MKVFSALYDFVLGLYGMTYLPKYFNKKYALRRHFKMPDIVKKTNGPLIWIHAVSVGETKAVSKLAKRLKEQLNGTLVFSNITATGHQEALKTIHFADYHVLFPLDFSWKMRALIDKVKPDLVILTETDFWYHFLTYTKANGATIAVVNGKISENSFKRLQYVPWFAEKIFSPVDVFCVQCGLYNDRFTALGVPKEKVHTVPNLKYEDTPVPVDSAELKNRLGISSADFIVVAGSTHPGEEALILEAFQKAAILNSKLIIVPRHPERFSRVADDLRKTGIKVQRYTENSPPENVILIDAMGLLRQCYSLASVAVVGGSFVPGIGGHNILEPLFYSVPVLFGPFMGGQPDMVEITLKYGIGKASDGQHLASDLTFSVPQEKFIQAREDIQGGVDKTFDLIMQKYACDKSVGAL